jgi:hypothetical protein
VAGFKSRSEHFTVAASMCFAPLEGWCSPLVAAFKLISELFTAAAASMCRMHSFQLRSFSPAKMQQYRKTKAEEQNEDKESTQDKHL